MRTTIIPDVDFQDRVKRLQLELAAADLDVLITYSSESEAASSRYLADFWPFFDFAGVIVPREGAPALVTGGPESYEFAKQFSRIKDIHIHPLFVESSAPDWVPPVTYEDFASILKSVCGRLPKRIGVADWNIFPHPIFADLQHAAAGAEIVPADEVLLRTKCIKSPLRDRRDPPGVLDHRAGDDRGAGFGGRGDGRVGDRGGRTHDHAPARRGGDVLPDLGLLRAEHPSKPVPLDQPADQEQRAGAAHLRRAAHGLLRQHVPAVRHRQDARPRPRPDERGAGRGQRRAAGYPARRVRQGRVRQLLQDPGEIRIRGVHPLRPGPRLRVSPKWRGSGSGPAAI